MDHRSIRIYIILFAIIFIQGIFVLKPFVLSEKTNTEIPQYYKIHEEQEKSWLEKVVSDPVALFTLVLTAFTGGLYLATRALWNSTEKLVIGAEKSSEMQLRAYVFPNDTLLNVDDGNISVFSNFKNCGQTPTYNGVLSGGVFIGTYPLEEKHFPDEPEGLPQSQGFIGPGISIHASLKLNDIIDRETYGLLVSGKAAIYFFGRISFLDAFDKKRFMKFCYFRTGAPSVGPMTVYQDFNDAT